MNATREPAARPSDLTVARTLAALLERLENSPAAVGADQYRSVVKHLADELTNVETDDGLKALLDASPATAQLYENMHYEQAGLCRSSLDFAAAAEVQARDAIARAKARR